MFTASAAAVEVAGLYQAELPVESTAPAERAKLTRAGMQEVVVRVSGGYQALDSGSIQEALRKPDRYLQQFSYLQVTSVNGQGTAQRLRLQFDPTLIDNLLRRARMPIWGKNRPNLLLWVTVDDRQGRQILGGGDDSPLKQGVIEQARRRGLPVLFPLMDLDDEQALSVVEAWGLFREPLERASARYQTEAVLAGRLYRNAEQQWTGRWQFIFNDQSFGFSAEAPDLESYPIAAIDFAADQLASYYAVNTAALSDEVVRFQVEGVNSLQSYAEVTSYLVNLAAVTGVATSGVDQDTLILTLTTEGEVDKLVEAIALDHKLIQRQKPRQEGDIGTTLYYRWYKR